jgi:hypothetical protein
LRTHRRRGTHRFRVDLQALTIDHRPKQGRRSGRLFANPGWGYRGGYSAVTDYIRRWRVESASSRPKPSCRSVSRLGEAFQFDWSDEAMVVGGCSNVQVAHLKLCASRAFWLVALQNRGHEMFDAHTRSFQALGGVTRRGIYNNMHRRGQGAARQAASSTPASPPCAATCSIPTSASVASGWERREGREQPAPHLMSASAPSSN